MIKVAITGADSPDAGELIRILVNHPDVEITSLVAPGHEGKQIQLHHHGLLGEEKQYFTSSLRPEQSDILFIADKKVKRSDILRLRETYPDLKLISLNHPENDIDLIAVQEEKEDGDEEDAFRWSEPLFALPEINRKALVRGAKTAFIPTPISSLTLVALYPLATHLLLSGDITLNISAPEDLVSKEMINQSIGEITETLHEVQRSFNGNINVNILPPSSKRGVELTMELPSSLDLEHLMRTYEMYDDHNFSYAVTTPVTLDDVKGTEKVIISLSLSKDGRLQLHSVSDGRLRGNAGEAVHVMNLMFGLHEKTGLYLKPYAY